MNLLTDSGKILKTPPSIAEAQFEKWEFTTESFPGSSSIGDLLFR